MTTSDTSSTTMQALDPNTPEEQRWDHKSHLMKMIKAFKKDINESLKEIQENIIK